MELRDNHHQKHSTSTSAIIKVGDVVFVHEQDPETKRQSSSWSCLEVNYEKWENYHIARTSITHQSFRSCPA